MLSRFFRRTLPLTTAGLNTSVPSETSGEIQTCRGTRGLTSYNLFMKKFNADPSLKLKVANMSVKERSKVMSEHFKQLSDDERGVLSEEARELNKTTSPRPRTEGKVTALAQKRLEKYVQLFAKGSADYPNPLLNTVRNQRLPRGHQEKKKTPSARSIRITWYYTLPEHQQEVLKADISKMMKLKVASGKHLSALLENGLLPHLFEVQLPPVPSYQSLGKALLIEKGLMGKNSAEEDDKKLSRQEALKKFQSLLKNDLSEEEKQELKSRSSHLRQERQDAISKFRATFAVAKPLIAALPCNMRLTAFQRFLKDMQDHIFPGIKLSKEEKQQQKEEKVAIKKHQKRQRDATKKASLAKKKEAKVAAKLAQQEKRKKTKKLQERNHDEATTDATTDSAPQSTN